MKKILSWTAVVLTGLFGILVSLLVFGSYWGLQKWDSLDINEIIFQLQAPLEGTDSGIIRDLTKGTEYRGQAFPPFMQEIITAGGLVPYINKK